jgi:hypothetical protein
MVLVACAKLKADRPMKAKELYVSHQFRMARRYAEQKGDRWFILSAAHGLLHPEMTVAPYDQTLSRMKIAERKTWAEKVKTQINGIQILDDKVIVLAGLAYRLELMPFLHQRFGTVEVPMRGLKQGEQLRWLKDSTRNPD